MARPVILLLLLILLASCGRHAAKSSVFDYRIDHLDKPIRQSYASVHRVLQELKKAPDSLRIHNSTRIDTIVADNTARRVALKFTAPLGFHPLREYSVRHLQQEMAAALPGSLRGYQVSLYAEGYPLEQFIPNYYRSNPAGADNSRRPPADLRGAPIVRNISTPWSPSAGLQNRHIALWPSHGWYYAHERRRWEWQRARAFQTVEDLLPFAFCRAYLIPMLENAGARVFLPRERDLQTQEVIVDNDTPGESGYREEGDWQSIPNGFATGTPPYARGDNPFRQGTSRSNASGNGTASWIPQIPQDGDYAVTIAYHSSPEQSDAAEYSVRHAGGETRFLVNQQIGGGTWIYLGTFPFRAGRNPARGSVVLRSSSSGGQSLSADAVRFGGGMGNIARNGRTSLRPRFVEGARYYMQYAGMPDTLVYNVTENPWGDYKDDYRGRGEWVNYLHGAPAGPNKKRDTSGLGIPLDLSLAFHTDAGISRNDTTIGTLMIYSLNGADTTDRFPGGMSRLANRDLGDIMQTQITGDLRRLYDPAWRRRSLWNSDYSEAFRPNVPAVLLELLSHHNFLDMKFALDPRFRFDAARAIYKGMQRFVCNQYQQPCVIQPLPVSHFQSRLLPDGGAALRWQAVADPLEPSALPDAYILYTSVEDSGFDNGVLLEQPQITLNTLEAGRIYRFRVTAVNKGGESFPSETLAVCRVENSKGTVLIVNGFDRVSGPAVIETGDMLGFADFLDQGVPDGYDMNYIGSQVNFHSEAKWSNNDSPGHGASYSDFETTIIPGNSFDYPYRHGLSIREAGYSFVSVSDEAVEDSLTALQDYRLLDLILGEEKATSWPKKRLLSDSDLREQLRREGRSAAETDSALTNGELPESRRFAAFSPALQRRLKNWLAGGGGLFVSGAYTGTDLFAGKKHRHPDQIFGTGVLKMYGRTNHASRRGEVAAMDSSFAPPDFQLTFNTAYHPDIYTVEAADGLEPADSAATTLLRYRENNLGAAIGYRGAYRVVTCGFPFEAVIAAEERHRLMALVLDYLERP